MSTRIAVHPYAEISASGATSGLRQYAEAQWRRILTQLDRDPASKLYGCFDRDHWHYKIRDFSSALLQQGAFTAEALHRGVIGNLNQVQRRRAGELAAAAVARLGYLADRAGGLDEYYPFERGYPPAAFGLLVACRLMHDWNQTRDPRVHDMPVRQFARIARHLLGRFESQALNQQTAGLAAVALASSLPGLDVDRSKVRQLADRVLACQHAEGWFPEYHGPDFGYLCVTIDALMDYFDATGDERAIEASRRAVRYLAGLVGADGRLPSTHNSRNTDYVVPYGLARMAQREGPADAQAAWLVAVLFRDAGEPSHFLWATDDRYHCHYVYASVIRALPLLDRMVEPAAPELQQRIWLPGCGYRLEWSADARCTVCVAAHKGGLIRVHRHEQPAAVDHGWRWHQGKHLVTSNWWCTAWKVTGAETEELSVQGAMTKAGPIRVSPFKHMVLRCLSWLFRQRMIPLLKSVAIFRSGASYGPDYRRQIHFADDAIEIEDSFAAPAQLPPASWPVPGPRQNFRHVASADSFSIEDLSPALLSPCFDWKDPLAVEGDRLVLRWRVDLKTGIAGKVPSSERTDQSAAIQESSASLEPAAPS